MGISIEESLRRSELSKDLFDNKVPSMTVEEYIRFMDTLKELAIDSSAPIKVAQIENVETIDAYKEKVKTDLTAQKEREAEENFTNELLGKVCDNANVEIPAVMIDAEVDRMYKEFEGRMQQSGFTAKQFLEATHQTEEAIRAQMSPEAAARVKTQLVLEAIVKAESIEASDEDVEKEFTTMSEMYNMEVEKIKSLISPESIKADLANQKALDFIKTSVK